jgi:beta-phosphoglucomutase
MTKMAKPRIDTILFDLDGTLVDTELAAAKAIYSRFEAWGLKITSEDASFITGRTWASAFDFLFKKYPIPVTAQTAAQEMMQAYRDSLATHLKIVPGGAEAVRALAKRYKLALVSGSNREEIFFALDKLSIREHFPVVLGAEDYPNSKPAPDGYQKALDLLGSQGQNTIVFEDSQPGIASGRAVGAWVVAIAGTNHFKQDTSRAHYSIVDLTGVNVEWVEKLCQQLTAKQ